MKFPFILKLVLFFLLIGNGCASFRQPHTQKNDIIPSEDLVSVAATIELARAAYNAGCVRTYHAQGLKGYFNDCRQAADKFIEEDVTSILKAEPRLHPPPPSAPSHLPLKIK